MTVIDKESRHNGAIYIEIKNYLEILSKGGSVIVKVASHTCTQTFIFDTLVTSKIFNQK